MKNFPRSRLEADTRQLATMLAAGIPLDHALAVLARRPRAARAPWAGILDDIREGTDFAASLDRQPRHFDAFHVTTMAAGEGCGRFVPSLERVADSFARRRALRARALTLFAYPLAVLSIAGTIVLLLAHFVVPIFMSFYTGFDAALPTPTRIVFAASRLVVGYGPVLALLAIALAMGAAAFLRRAPGRPVARALERLLLALPGLGPALWTLQSARFSLTLATAMEAGIPLLEGMDMATRCLGFSELRARARRVRAEVAAGTVFWVAVERARLLPVPAVRVLEVGERAGTLSSALDRLARLQDEETKAHGEAFLAAFGPLLTVFTGALVSAVLISMYLPVFRVCSVI